MRAGYGTAEEFLVAMLQVQETIKPQFVNELLEKIDIAVAAEDYERCLKLLARIRRIDPATGQKKQFEMFRRHPALQRFNHEKTPIRDAIRAPKPSRVTENRPLMVT